ncbi:hypothetical protein BIT28_18875 [Photobacterium proteolyticum]|uniref:N-acetyltransferase domain-containing protein n=1 Tax=Photobacterium proteolyticum TaxID=1903952 RepID=A0A1Q9GN43_9GAMM|nr:GNAT family N-acetyltransferase [Photobacterium proteolyticum]OLQ76082.1 hypothetical protein BIT28_18875 [Photobacterium proteolyticum]
MNIDLASTSDINAIRSFIKDNWAPNHIFARDADFFEYEMTDEGTVNFVVAKNELQQICGLVGFTKSKKQINEANLFLVILCVLPEYAKQGLSFKLINKCIELTSGSVNTVGAAPSVLPLYKLLGFQTGYLKHYFWLNPELNSFELCQPGEKQFVQVQDTGEFVQVSNVLEEEFCSLSTERRDYETFVKRYLEHPTYEYLLYLSKSKDGLIVAREVSQGQAKALKVIDYFGDNAKLTGALIKLTSVAVGQKYEFIDLYVKGTEDTDVQNAGFDIIDTNGDVVIPNYFSPFVMKNIQLTYATRDESLILMRGDGDQDRPS